jgi:hypothetical protein
VTAGSNGAPIAGTSTTPALPQQVDELLEGQLDADLQVLHAAAGCQGSLQIVDDREHVAQDVAGRELPEVLALALGAAAVVLEVGEGADRAVAQVGELGLQLGDRGVGGASAPGRRIGGLLLRHCARGRKPPARASRVTASTSAVGRSDPRGRGS